MRLAFILMKFMNMRTSIFAVLILFSVLSSCKTITKWNLVWSDEFNYSGMPDSNIWNYDTAGNAWGWGNNELQFYTHSNPQNVNVDNGVLSIIARKDSISGKHYSSARLTTKDKKPFQYGRIEVRAKLPKGKGLWPAVWMLGQNIDSVGWPLCGEIDIMEYVGYQPDTVYATIHSEAYNHMKNTQKMKSTFIANPYDFNIYAIEWTEEKIDFFYNNILYNTIINEHKSVNEWPFSTPFYLLLNVAVGGNWGGKHGVDDTIFPAKMEVDYVRLYEKKK